MSETDAQRHLWCAVISVALEDAQGRIAGNESTHRDLLIAKARHWLTSPNKDFNRVCYLAGLDPIAVRERAAKLLSVTNAA